MSLSVSVLRPRVVSTIPISTLRRVDEKKNIAWKKRKKKNFENVLDIASRDGYWPDKRMALYDATDCCKCSKC